MLPLGKAVPLVDQGVSAKVLVAAACAVSQVVETLTEELGGPPALGELLEVLESACPTLGPAASVLPVPLQFKIVMRRRQSYTLLRESRVSELNDESFVEASDFWSLLVESMSNHLGRIPTVGELNAVVFRVLKESGPILEDVSTDDMASLKIGRSAGLREFNRGDIVAIPLKTEGYRFAVVVDRNRFGTALGILRGTSPFPRMGDFSHCEASGRPLYTDSSLISAGKWAVVGRSDEVASLFPEHPEIYHDTMFRWRFEEIGEFGAAEHPEGGLRTLGKQEAESVGLLDGRYQQTYLSSEVPELLEKCP